MQLSSLLAALALIASSPAPGPGDASYSVPVSTLDAALACDADLGSGALGEPVLLVHGTGANREANFKWNYWPALRGAGFRVCWVELPHAALGDMQIAAEYVARAVEVMHERSGERIDVVGHSQGGVLPRWAASFFPSGAFVDDLVSLAAPNHGTIHADLAAASGRTAEAVWQMRVKSDFIAALNRGDETPGGVSYTSIYTAADEVVQPWTTAALAGASNVLLQDVCPARGVTHVSIVVDAVAYAVALDALTHPGPADPARVPLATCLELTMPGARPALPGSFPVWSEDVITSEEPPLKDYAR